MNIAEHVSLATAEERKAYRCYGGGRAGTLRGLTLQQFAKVFGNPHEHGDGEKVTASWFFVTPRGMVAVHDYWWNKSDELSIGLRNATKGNPFGDPRAMLWVRKYFRALGLNAS